MPSIQSLNAQKFLVIHKGKGSHLETADPKSVKHNQLEF